MAYRVIKAFHDLRDNNHPYKVGEMFPRLGTEVSKERAAELLGANNRQGVPLIEKVVKKKVKRGVD